jgi:hypothetical protein
MGHFQPAMTRLHFEVTNAFSKAFFVCFLFHSFKRTTLKTTPARNSLGKKVFEIY